MLEIGNKTGELLKPSEIVNHLIDNYLDDAVKDLISKEELKKKKGNVIPFPAFSRLPAKDRKDTV
nr:hypothetical protein [Escherichia coli]